MSAAAPRALLLLGWLVALWFVLDGVDRHTPSNDEWVQHHYGELLWRFYRSGFTDTSFLTFSNLRFYGGFFDLIAAAGTTFFGWLPWPWRHLLTALFGLLALWGTVRLARWVARPGDTDRISPHSQGTPHRGAAAAALALWLMLLTGPFWGAIFTHTKDIPFAAAMVWGLYYTGRVAESPLYPKRRHVALWGIATGMALGLRAAGVLLMGFLGVALLVSTWRALAWQRAEPRERLRFLAQQAMRLLPGMALALIIIAVTWPWSVMGWTNVAETLQRFSHFAFAIYTWEEGERLLIEAVSRWYLFRYLLARLPEVVWLGVAFALVGLWRWRFRTVFVAAALAFVLLYVTALRPPLYNGLRHFLFLIPWVVVLAAYGLAHVTAEKQERIVPRLALAAALGLGGLTAVTLGRLHPYEHVYYNALAGGLPRAADRWETDYWSDATRALVPAIAAWQSAHPERAVVHLAYCAEPFQIEPWLPSGVVITRDWFDADLFLSTTHDDCDRALAGPEIARIERLGVPLAVLKAVGHLNRPPPPLP